MDDVLDPQKVSEAYETIRSARYVLNGRNLGHFDEGMAQDHVFALAQRQEFTAARNRMEHISELGTDAEKRLLVACRRVYPDAADRAQVAIGLFDAIVNYVAEAGVIDADVVEEDAS